MVLTPARTILIYLFEHHGGVRATVGTLRQ